MDNPTNNPMAPPSQPISNATPPASQPSDDDYPQPNQPRFPLKKVIILVVAAILGFYAFRIGGRAISGLIASQSDDASKQNSDKNKPDSNADPSDEKPDTDVIVKLFTTGAQMSNDRLSFDDACSYLNYLINNSEKGSDIRKYPLSEKTIKKDEASYYETVLAYTSTINKYIGNIFTGSALDQFVAKRFANVNSVLYCSTAGGASSISITNVKVTLLSQNKDSHTYTYKAFYETRSPGQEDVEGTKTTSQFTVQQVDDGYKISATNLISNDLLNKSRSDIGTDAAQTAT